MKEFKVSVKTVVNFLYSSGDLTSEFSINSNLLDGKNAHLAIQKQFKVDDIKEYYVKNTVQTENYSITVNGYIDGVLHEDGKIILLEIKTTYTNLDDITLDFHKEYLAQLMFYAYIYSFDQKLDEITIRLMYVSLHDISKQKVFTLIKSFNELRDFYLKSIQEYVDFYMHLDNALTLKINSIKSLVFPFKNYRKGQRDFMKAIYQTMIRNEILYALAPTGIGKTMASLFSTLKTITKKEEKLFYLTSKNVLKEVALKASRLLLNNNLQCKVIEITAKDKACLCEEKKCDPNICIYAKGFFNKLKNATFDLYANEDVFDYEVIKTYAIKHVICPFEFSLHMSYYADIVICDYNYAFDPQAHLIRYFDSDEFAIKLLVDEAHNLVSRSRDMYSEILYYDDLKKLIELCKESKYQMFLAKEINKLTFFEDIEDNFIAEKEIPNILISSIEKIIYYLEDLFINVQNFLNKDSILEIYFKIKSFLKIATFFDNDFIFIIEKEPKLFFNIQCLDAAKFIKRVLDKCYGTIFFSATLTPIHYYKDLLSQGVGSSIIINYPFDCQKQLVLCRPISTKYQDRNKTIPIVIESILSLINLKEGNYMVFFPSYEYMLNVYKAMPKGDYNIYIQEKEMDESSKKDIFKQFNSIKEAKVGFFVLGGSFSEGLDFENNSIMGCIIVGVGLPVLNYRNNLFKNHFNKNNQGFDYTYTFPGYAKVVQAAGRVIRSEDDFGVVILLDDRYLTRKYQNLAPSSFNNFKICNDIEQYEETIKTFFSIDDLSN